MLTAAVLKLAAIIAVAAALIAAALAPVRSDASTMRANAAHRCAEDDPCWRWPRMGNHRRGVTLLSGRTVIVAPCRFARLARRDRIDWTHTKPLRGDGWAIRHCRRIGR